MRRAVIAVAAGVAALGLPTAGWLPAQARPAGPLGNWPMYGADLANSRTVTDGPAAAAAAGLHVAWRDSFSDGDFTGTPVVSNGVVLVGSNGGVVRAIRAVPAGGHPAGSVIWSAKASGPIDGSLAVLGGTVYVPVARPGSPQLLALDAASGATRWATVLDTSTDADVYGSPVPVNVAGRMLVLEGVSATSGDPASPLRGSLNAVDGATGNVVWKTYMVPPGFNGGAVWSTPAVDAANGNVYVGTGNAYSGTAAPTTDSVIKLDLRTGAILSWFQATAGDVFSSTTPGFDFDFGASPNLFGVGNRLIVGEGEKGGVYWALDRSTMKPIWDTTVGAGSALGGILGSTAYDSATGQIVGPETLPGYLWSLASSDGTPKWITPGGLDEIQWSPVSISNGIAYSIASTGFIEAWNEATGILMTAVPLNPIPPPGSYILGLGSGVAIADGLVIADLGTGSNGTGIVAALSP